MVEADLALEVLPGESEMVIGLFHLHLCLKPFLQAGIVYVFHRTFAFTSLDLWIILIVGVCPTKSAHMVFLFLRDIFDLLGLTKFGADVFMGTLEELGFSSELFNLKFHSSQFDNVMFLDRVPFVSQASYHEPEAVIGVVFRDLFAVILILVLCVLVQGKE